MAEAPSLFGELYGAMLFRNADGQTPLVRSGRKLKIVSHFHDLPNESEKMTLLVATIHEGDRELVQAIVDNGGVAIDQAGTAGKTLLYHAAIEQEPDLKLIRYLLSKGADPDRDDILRDAVFEGKNPDVVKLLVRSVRDYSKEHDLAQSKGLTEIARVFDGETIRRELERGGLRSAFSDVC